MRKVRTKVSLFFILLVSCIALFSQAPQYSTSFPLTENPISESGKWINGKVVGLDWGNIQTIPGMVFGTTMPAQYADPTAVLTGTWAADQQAQATVKLNTVFSNCCHEVELRLRTTIAAHSIKGYEINCSVGNLSYIQIVRWNGPLGNFTQLNGTTDSCKNGDILKATIQGSTITVFKNGTQVLTVGDSTFASGAPGLGFYDDADTQWNQFGFSDFSAQNIGGTVTTPPAPPTNLTSGTVPINPLVIITSSLPAATVGQPYSATMTASGGTPPYTWSISGQPAWLSISTAGVLSGTPSAAAPAVSFTITVTDSRNATAREVIR